MKKVKVAEKYDLFAGKGVKLGLVDQRDAKRVTTSPAKPWMACF